MSYWLRSFLPHVDGIWKRLSPGPFFSSNNLFHDPVRLIEFQHGDPSRIRGGSLTDFLMKRKVKNFFFVHSLLLKQNSTHTYTHKNNNGKKYLLKKTQVKHSVAVDSVEHRRTAAVEIW